MTMTLITRSFPRLLLYSSLLLYTVPSQATPAQSSILSGSDVATEARHQQHLLSSCRSDLESRACLYCLTAYGSSIMLDCCTNPVTLRLCVDFIDNLPPDEEPKSTHYQKSDADAKFSNGDHLNEMTNSRIYEYPLGKTDVDKRPKHFLGKRDGEEFQGEPTYDDTFPTLDDDSKRAKYFLGKRPDNIDKTIPVMADDNKRAKSKYFLGKRQDDNVDGNEKRAKSKYFLGKRPVNQISDDKKRAKSKYFLGKRLTNWFEHEEKRAKSKYFLGKRQDEVTVSKSSENSTEVKNSTPETGTHRLRKRSAQIDDEIDKFEDEGVEKRVRQKYFLGKRGQKFFLGKRSEFDLMSLLRNHPFFQRVRSDDDDIEEKGIPSSRDNLMTYDEQVNSTEDQFPEDFQEVSELGKRAKGVVRSVRRGKYFLG